MSGECLFFIAIASKVASAPGLLQQSFGPFAPEVCPVSPIFPLSPKTGGVLRELRWTKGIRVFQNGHAKSVLETRVSLKTVTSLNKEARLLKFHFS